MKVGIIGAGSVTLDFADRAAKSGHEVLISNPRGIHTLKEVVLKMGSNVKLASTQEAAAAEIIILFLSREDLEVSISNLPDMEGKIILHTNNPIFNLESFSPSSEPKSSSEIVAELLPKEHIVKIFNTIGAVIVTPEKEAENKTKIFFSVANQKVKNSVKAFLETLNFSGIDLALLKQLNALN